LQFNLCLALSDMLHDLAREGDAATVLNVAVDQMQSSDAVRNIVIGELEREPNNVISTARLYSGLHAGKKKEFEREMAEYSKGIEAQYRNADLLIAMHRVEEPTEEFRAKTKKLIEKVSNEIHQEIELLRAEIKRAKNDAARRKNGELAFRENEYAWLVGNTIGDIEEAIRSSEHSLKVLRDDPGNLDTLARCHFRAGNLKKAVEIQRRAAKLAPHEHQIRRQLELFERTLAESGREKQADDEPQ